jgi:hypothetical protein
MPNVGPAELRSIEPFDVQMHTVNLSVLTFQYARDANLARDLVPDWFQLGSSLR